MLAMTQRLRRSPASAFHRTLHTRNPRRLTQLLIALISGLVLWVAPAHAQTASSTGLAGRVSDQTEAALPGVTVTLQNIDTGSQRIVTTGSDGAWEARFLTPGVYRVTFELASFRPLRRDGVTVTTSEMGTVNVALEIGGTTDVVEVSASANMVSSDSATIVRTLDRRELDNLPTSARNFTQLLVTEPGVSADLSELLSNNNASVSPSVNGARTTNNSFVFNGIDVTSLLCCNSRVNGDRGTIAEGGGTLSRNMAPALETLEEVKLQTSMYDVATGRNGGGNFQLVSKSGSNQLSGTAYYFLQSDRLNANDYFLNRASIDRPVLKRHEGGVTLGGPIRRNKTFFFGSYQRTDAQTGFVDEASNTVRLPRALTDDRSDEGINQFAGAIWNPVHGPFNAGAINPISRSLLKASFEDGSYLIPSGANGINCSTQPEQVAESCQVTSVIPATYEQNQFSGSVDQQVTSSNRLSVKFFRADQPSRDPLASGEALTRFEAEEETNQRTFSLSDVHIFGSGIVNELRVGVFRNRNNTVPVSHFTNAQFGIQNPFAASVPDLSQIAIDADDVGSGLMFGTAGGRVFDTQTTMTFGNTLSLSRGSHSFRLGGELRRHHLDGVLRELANRRHNFDNWFDFLTVGYPDPADGNPARQISDSSINFGETARRYRMTDWSLFVADDWRASSRLTLNAGIRYDYFGMPTEADGLFAVFDHQAALATGNIQDGLVFPSNFNPALIPGASGLNLRIAGSKSIIPGDYNNIAPRIGFAWTPFDNDRTVLRGGYGLFYERTTGAFASSLRQSGPFFREAQRNNLGDWNIVPDDYAPFPIPSMTVGFDDGDPYLEGSNAPGIGFEALETQILPPDLSTPYIQQWNINTQWEFRPNWLLEVGYVGSKGTGLLQMINQNPPLDVSQLGFLPRPGVPGGGFKGNYYEILDDQFVSLQNPPADCDLADDPDECVIPAELRGALLGLDEDEGANAVFSNGSSIYHSLQTSLLKRFSRGFMFNASYSLSRSTDTFSDEGLYQVQNDQSHPERNRGLSDFDRRHRLIVSWVWELPFRGSRWTEGWQLSGIGTIQSGRPFTIVDDDGSAILFASTAARPNLAPGATLDDQTMSGPISSRIDNYLNRAAFESSGIAFGTLGRNTVIGPMQRRLDLNLSKVTPIGGGRSVELRVEAYNVTNTPSFRNPNSDLSSGAFGQITRTLGAKLRF
jgi:hypothetical protein